MKSIVRVATLNNFNCTEPEWAQLKDFPNYKLFINCNAKTKLLETINNHPYPAVVTVNPDIYVNPALVSRVLKLKNISFVRVKWLPNNPAIQTLIKTLRTHHFQVVITAQRFNGTKTLEAYTQREHYQHSCSRFRLNDKALRDLRAFAKKTGAHICDNKGLGCQGCGLCSTLNGGKKSDKILSLNLSTSGLCPFNCPDCYAKTMQKFRVNIGRIPLRFDVVAANKKQSGGTKHIKLHRKNPS